MTIIDEIEHGLAVLVQAAVGLFFMLGGAAGVVWEKMNPPSHDAHLLGWAVLSLVGACIIPSIGPVLTKSLRAIVGVVLTILPTRPPKDDAP